MKFPYSSKHPLPSAWDQRAVGAGNDRAMRFLKVEGLSVRYVGPGEDDSQAASIRANQPAPPDLPIFYFEVEVVSRGMDGFIGVGLSGEDVPLFRLPGWEPHSYGYHGDDGCKFNGSGRAAPYGPNFSTGDVVGVLWQRAARSISFFKNGADLGVAFSGVAEERLFPTVGMRTRDEEVRVNFGASPFKADLHGLLYAYRQSVLAEVAGTRIHGALAPGQPPLLARLLFQHLVHERCWQTAAVVARDVLGSSVQFGETEIEEVKARQAIYEAVASGRIDVALQLLQKHYGGTPLQQRPRLAFRLRVQQFVEMLRPGGAGPQVALQYGRAQLGPAVQATADDEMFIDALSLLAYTDPAASPAGHLMQPRQLQQLAEEVNDAIMAAAGGAAAAAAGGGGSVSGSVLERLYRHGTAAVEELQQLGDLQACEVTPQELVLEQLQ